MLKKSQNLNIISYDMLKKSKILTISYDMLKKSQNLK